MGDRAQHLGELVDIGAAAAKLGRHAGLNQACGLQVREILGDEPVLVRLLLGAPREDRAELLCELDRAARF